MVQKGASIMKGKALYLYGKVEYKYADSVDLLLGRNGKNGDETETASHKSSFFRNLRNLLQNQREKSELEK